MFKSPSLWIVLGLASSILAGQVHAQSYQIGSPATEAEIAGWDIDIRPDGKGLPAGSGNAVDGEASYDIYCASCHGVFGEGVGRWPVLVGGEDTLADDRPVKTVGSYWPFASTLFDYIRRAMPFAAPMSLDDQQVYDITAYVLYMNDIIEEDFELSQTSLAQVIMPNEDGFFVDNRPDVQNPRCMSDCADADSLMMQGSLSGVTPIGHFVEGADAPAASHAGQDDLEASKEAQRKASITGDELVTTIMTEPAAMSAAAIAGEATYKAACGVCHASGLAGAPKVNDASAWSQRLQQGNEVLISHALQGFAGSTGYMPAKGGRADLSDEQVTNAVLFMVESQF
jgi:cytochrome c